jgi:diaminohydroxyphosphoribosylaminopyrimidine deaminase/5-amino-6-(5-phosphoribosylamino)uracil reductase
MVGAVVVRDGLVVGEGYHARFGEEHAEVAALRAAGERARGATLYVTLEPCVHQGKTPPCVDAVIRSGVERVVIAAADPTPLAGGGAQKLRGAGLKVTIGDGEAESRQLNAPFFHANTTRPWIQLKLATSLDGALADGSGRSRWVSGPQARRVVQSLRANSDAIAVGVRTAMIDEPSLTVRGRKRPRVEPLRVVFDSAARLPVDSALVKSARKTPLALLVSSKAQPARLEALRTAGVEILPGDSLDGWMAALSARGVRSLLVEGGARLAGSLLDHGIVDRMIIFQAPIVLGAGALNGFGYVGSRRIDAPLRFRVIERRVVGDDLMTVLEPQKD